MTGDEYVMACLRAWLEPIEIERLIKQAHDDIPLVKLGYRLSPSKDKEVQKYRRQAKRRRHEERIKANSRASVHVH